MKMAKDLRTFLRDLKGKKPANYLEVEKKISSQYEVCALLKHMEDAKMFSTVLFKNVTNLKGVGGYSVVSNLATSRESFAIAMDLPPEKWRGELTREASKRSQNPVPPRVISEREAPVKENIIKGKAVDLRNLPMIRHHAMDGGPYFTMGCVAKHPAWGSAPGLHNASFHRMQYKDPTRTGIHMSPLHTWHIFKSYEEKNLPCPIAVVIGHHPVFYVGANMSPPADVSEYDVIGGLMNEPLLVTPSETLGKDFLVPANAEIIVEGEILPNIREPEGPFGEWTRYYGPQRSNPVVKIKAITHRNNPLFLDTFIGHRDDYPLGWETTVYNRAKEAVHTVIDVHLPYSARWGYAAYIRMKKTVPGQPVNAALAALTWGFLKLVVVVDEDIDVFNEEEVWWAVATRVQAAKRVQIFRDLRGSILDPSIGETVEHDAMVIDATKPDPFAEPVAVPEEALKKIRIEDFIDKNVLKRYR
jgi:2,5-furandicarboxylate decarboxylase 1